MTSTRLWLWTPATRSTWSSTSETSPGRTSPSTGGKWEVNKCRIELLLFKGVWPKTPLAILMAPSPCMRLRPPPRPQPQQSQLHPPQCTDLMRRWLRTGAGRKVKEVFGTVFVIINYPWQVKGRELNNSLHLSPGPVILARTWYSEPRSRVFTVEW